MQVLPHGTPAPDQARRPLLLSYGGGHAQIIIAVAAEMDRRGIAYDLLGLTTAHAAFLRAGLRSQDVSALLVEDIDSGILAKAGAFTPPSDNPDVTDEQTRAYFALGYEDLVQRFGQAEADRRVAELGRKAFEPVTGFRRYLEALRPSVVVTTTSPRSELAAIKAARELGIPSVAIGDMYLVAEQEWILDGCYADHLVVMSEDVGEMLEATGRLTSQIEVLGNPAFDALAPRQGDEALRARLRSDLGIGDRTCILWPLGGAADEVMGRFLLSAEEVARFLDALCDRDPSFCFVLRPHPNWPVAPMELAHGVIDSAMTLEESLLACDLVCVEASTVGLQAVLRGKPTVCLAFADYVLYPRYGWASEVDTLDELAELVLERRFFSPPPSLGRYVGGAAGRVVDLIASL